jgi:hypothetical protein
MAFAALVLLLATADPAKPSVTVVVAKGHAPTAEALASSNGDVELRLAELPNAPEPHPSAPALPQERVAAARTAYVNADFTKCLEEVSDEAALTTALGQGDRSTAARMLLWQVACNVGANKLEPGRRAATQLVGLSLQVPAEVGSVSPEVENVIAQALKAASQQKPLAIEVSGTADAQIELDGRPAGCTVPCTLEALEGLHVVRLTADGHEPVVRTVRAEPPRVQLAADLPDAAPELAAAQWSARYRLAADSDGDRSVRLLSTALRASRLVLLAIDDTSPGKLDAVLAVDGAITARAERVGSPGAQLSGLMTDLLVRGQVVAPTVPIYKRALFWVAIAGAAVVAAGVTGGVIAAHQTDTTVRFR